MQTNILVQVGTVTADNASNNDLLMDALRRMLPNFRGRHCRVRCYAHILNLTAKAILRQFEVQKKKNGNAPDNDDETNPFPFLGPLGGGLDDDDTADERDAELVNPNELPDLVDGDTDDNEANEKDEDEEIIDVFRNMGEEAREKWANNVKPVRTAIHKVSHIRLGRTSTELIRTVGLADQLQVDQLVYVATPTMG